MKKHFLILLVFIAAAFFVNAQAPNAIPYQGVARNAAGNILASQPISLRISIHDVTAVGTVVFSETHAVSTNTLGLFNINIGSGSAVTGSLAGVNWASGDKFIQVEMDPAGGVAYADMGTTQLNSVPYALNAKGGGGGFRVVQNYDLGPSTYATNQANGELISGNATTVAGANFGAGAGALNLITTGNLNTGVGNSALGSNSTGSSNTAIGSLALVNNATGNNNTAIGSNALRTLGTGDGNTAVGPYALRFATTGAYNIALGVKSGEYITTGNENISIGQNTFYSGGDPQVGSTGSNNIALGSYALNLAKSGSHNIGIGAFAAGGNGNGGLTGSGNNGIGTGALQFIGSGSNNAAMGPYALRWNVTGSDNTAIGNNAGNANNNTNGNGNTFLGAYTTTTQTDLTNATAIGNGAVVDANDKVQIGNSTLNAVQLGTGSNVTLETGLVKLTGGSPGAGKVLTSDANGLASWQSTAGLVGPQGPQGPAGNDGATGPQGPQGPAGSVSALAPIGNTPNTNGATLTGTVLNLEPADANNAGVITTGTQTIAGNKTFTSDIQVNQITVGEGAGNSSTGIVGIEGKNLAVGRNALAGNTDGFSNVAVGNQALQTNNVGRDNIAVGNLALQNNTTGSFNTAVGSSASRYNVTGDRNTGVGNQALSENISGSGNTAHGYGALFLSQSGSNNTGMGNESLRNNSSGNDNTAVGTGALWGNQLGSGNTAIGTWAGVALNNQVNSTAIGANAIVDASNKVQIGDGQVNAVQLGTGSNVTLETGLVKLTGGSPAAGKVLTSDANGLATWQTPATNHYVGESYGGGIVFKVWDNGQHGLIAAPTDIGPATGIQWYNGIDRTTGAANMGLNGGKMNTAIIVSTQISDNQSGNFAAKLCANAVYYGGVGSYGFGDWYLPSFEELYQLNAQKDIVGGFVNGTYWSSTEFGSGTARVVDFEFGSGSVASKSMSLNVRAIRAF